MCVCVFVCLKSGERTVGWLSGVEWGAVLRVAVEGHVWRLRVETVREHECVRGVVIVMCTRGSWSYKL